jgi:hypothetical protein
MRRKIAFAVVAVLSLSGAFMSCENMMITIYGYSRMVGTDQLEGVGTVVYIRIEGGFYGIIAGSDGQWDPINLPAGYMQDGLKVKFQAKLRKDLNSTHMWGTMVELTSINKI